MQLSVDVFEKTVRNCRSKESSGSPESRSDSNPSYRQCLVTALLAHEILWLSVFAEKITNEHNRIGHHFFNKDTENIPIRFCEEQFAYEKILARHRERPLNEERIEFLLERHPEIKQRYELFKKKFETELTSIFR